MNATEALRRLRALGASVVTTADAAVVLSLSVSAASHTLRRLRASGIVSSLRKGVWIVGDPPDPLALVEHVTAPYPAYVSLQSALHLRGLIEQVPHVVYVVSTGRSRRVETAVAVFSIHHVPPTLFGGFEYMPDSGIKLATAEKALIDLLYLSGTRSRLFRSLPELELPRGFRAAAERWIREVPPGRSRTMVNHRLEEVMALASRGRRTRSP